MSDLCLIGDPKLWGVYLREIDPGVPLDAFNKREHSMPQFKFLQRQKGNTVVEYAIFLALIAGSMYVASGVRGDRFP